MTLSKCYRGSSGKLKLPELPRPHAQPSPQEAPEYFVQVPAMSHREELHPGFAEAPGSAADGRLLYLPPATAASAHRLALYSYRPPHPARNGRGIPDSAFKAAPDTGFIHVNAAPEENTAFRQRPCCAPTVRNSFEAILSIRTTIFPSRSPDEREPPRPVHTFGDCTEALSDGDLSSAIAYATQVIDRVHFDV